MLSYFLGLGFFIYYSFIHAFLSSYSSSLGIINPHYLVSVFALSYLTFFTVGIVFLSFDLRARDQRDRIVDVMDCRPITNFELLAGRCLGIFLVSWIPLVILCLLFQGLGWLLPLLGSPVGNTVEFFSLLGFALYMAIPTISFSISMVFFITLLTRQRMLAALVSLAVLGGMFWGALTWSLSAVPLLDFMGMASVHFPSDITSAIAVSGGWLQRFAFLILSFSLLGFATIIHPRLDGGNKQRVALISGGIFSLAIVMLLVSSQIQNKGAQQVEQWLQAHQNKAQELIPDIVSISGSISVDPGNSMNAEFILRVQAPESSSLTKALFTLNPGFDIEQVTDSNGRELSTTFANGLLEIEFASPLSAGTSTSINISYAGKPETNFGYLDTSLVVDNIIDSNNQVLLGYETAIFDPRFVTLMPGNYWLPLAGVDIARDDTRSRERDYFSIDLSVELPSTWLAAGPGQRSQASQNQDRVIYQFAPDTQVAEVAVIAAEFEKFETQVSGVNFEILVHPEHTVNFEVLAPIQRQIEQWVADRLSLAADAGLNYAFNTFTLVEVPNSLRGYKGGWRMDTSMSPPSMMLMRESSFPTSRFDFNLSFSNSFVGDSGAVNTEVNLNADSFGNVDLERLINFFANDMTGGNLFSAFSRSLFSDQTSSTGNEAIALDFILENLANLVVSDSRAYFSMYSDYNEVVTSVITRSVTTVPGSNQSISSATIDELTSSLELWNSSLNSSLNDIDPLDDPEQTINLLTLKAGQLAQAIYDTLGAQGSGQLLSSILNEHREGSYTMTDFLTALANLNLGLEAMVNEIMSGTQLPGFIVDNVDLYRLPDGNGGQSRYQLIVALRNDEAVVGFTRFSWRMPGEDNQVFRSEPIRIEGQSAVEFGIVLSEPPIRVTIEPYLSLNRNQFLARIFTSNTEVPERNEAELNGIRSIAWDKSMDRIIADDLDLNFRTSTAGVIDNNEEARNENDPVLDQGIPVNTGNAPLDWNRITSVSAYGKYRHTFTSIVSGDGDKKAILTSTIPNTGLWDLEMFMPEIPPNRAENFQGTWHLEIISSNGTEQIEFNVGNAFNGWNLIGPYQLPAGEVRIELSNESDAASILVDAFAWSPVSGN